MRPCRQCRSPIENNVAVCPQCNTAQDDRAKPPGPVPPPVLRRKLFGRAPTAPQAGTDSPPRRGSVVRLFDTLAGEAFIYLLLPVVLGAVVGGALAGVRGAIVGGVAAVATIELIFGVLSLLGSSEG